MVPTPSWCLSGLQEGWSPHLCCSLWFSTFFSAWLCTLWASFWFRGSLGIPWRCTGTLKTSIPTFHILISNDRKPVVLHSSRIVGFFKSLGKISSDLLFSVAQFEDVILWHKSFPVLCHDDLWPSFVSRVTMHCNLPSQSLFKPDTTMKLIVINYWSVIGIPHYISFRCMSYWFGNSIHHSVLNHDKHHLSPYVIMVLLIIFSMLYFASLWLIQLYLEICTS